MWSFDVNQPVRVLADGTWHDAEIISEASKNSFNQDVYQVRLIESQRELKRVYYLIRNADGTAPSIAAQ